MDYPGILQSLEKLIQIDNTLLAKKRAQLVKNGKGFIDLKGATNIELDVDYLNSVILHSDPGYIRLASSNKCRFYDTLINDLLKNAEGKIKDVIVTYTNKAGTVDSGIITKKDFLNVVVARECPQSQKLIDEFQVKNLEQTIKSTTFDIPTGIEQCRTLLLDWVNNTRTPYYCKLHEFMKEAALGAGDPADLANRQAIAKIVEKKLNLTQREYIENLCQNLDSEKMFCDQFLNVSFWSKVAGGYADKVFAEDICGERTSDAGLRQCVARLRRENDLCLYPTGRNTGLTPQPDCESLSTALNHSNLKSSYRDCASSSDQQTVTTLARLVLHLQKEKPGNFQGPCSAVSSGVSLEFNRKNNNDEVWRLEACYPDQFKAREVCLKTFFGGYANDPQSYTNVVAGILRITRGTDPTMTCTMVDSEDYNPLLLQYKSGCYIIYDRKECFIQQCKHKILLNDRPIDFIALKNRVNFDLFPSSIRDERYSMHYVLTNGLRYVPKTMTNLSAMKNYFKRSKIGIVYGIGCAEDILPAFFRSQHFNQCTPLPFVIDGMLNEGDKTVLVTRTGADSSTAPRLVSWSYIFSGVKGYQKAHPLRQWMLYGLD